MPSKKPRMQLYADECFPVTTVTYLKSLGISIVHAYEKNFIEKSDRFHLEASKKLKRLLITLDRDFNEYEQAVLKGCPGVIIISVGSATPPHVNLVAQKVIKQISAEFARESLIKVTMSKIIKIKEGVRTEKLL